MAAAKTTATKKAAERKAQKKSLAFRGIELSIPPELPPTFAFDLAQIEGSKDDAPFGAVYALITSLITPEDFGKVRDAIASEKSDDGGVGILFELIGEIAGAYGSDEGK